MKQKIGIVNLGCPRNLVDSESIIGRLESLGHRIVDIEHADVGIINTCAFINDAKQESVDAILDLIELKKKGRLKKILVYGCLSQRYQETLVKELPEVDAFIGKVTLDQPGHRHPITPRHYAYLKICEGCVNNCSYCIIPKIKGKFVSLDEASVLKQVDALDRQRISELNVIGQDITGYGFDKKRISCLAGLVKKIAEHSGHIGWVRLLYLNPQRIDDELLCLVRDTPRLCKYIDLPVQHINDRILRLMNRPMTKKKIIRLIERIRKMIPGVALRTSVIVGLPSETDGEFKELCRFIEEAQFERLGAFIYSREENTPAYHFKKQIPKKMKISRFNAIMLLQQRISEKKNKRLLGSTMDVLIDEYDNGHYLGRSQADAPEVDGTVYVSSVKRLAPGDFVKAHITDTLEYDLVGEVTP